MLLEGLIDDDIMSNPSLDENAVSHSIFTRSEKEVALIFNFKGTLLSVKFEQYLTSYSISIVFTQTE